jgi:hypothetical protein
MHAYSTAEWQGLFIAEAGASAALAGLLFVAISINLARILQGAGLPGRAGEAIVLLVAVLVISTLALVPGQSPTVLGAELLAGVALLRGEGLRVVRSHHERWDGSGYPYGLNGEHIPLSGRIVTVADVFDALTHDRPYKHAWPVERAVAEITAQRGHQFDPNVVDAFLSLLDRGVLQAVGSMPQPEPSKQTTSPQP